MPRGGGEDLWWYIGVSRDQDVASPGNLQIFRLLKMDYES